MFRLKLLNGGISSPPTFLFIESWVGGLCRTGHRIKVSNAQNAACDLAGARKLVDGAYHGYYTLERQQFQDKLVTELVETYRWLVGNKGR